MSSLRYYKVSDQSFELYKKCKEFINYENELFSVQKESIKATLPKFTRYSKVTGFNRIPKYIGFEFNDKNDIDKSVWRETTEKGVTIFVPNRRTKKGREMAEFLNNFKRTSCWDVDALLNIEKTQIIGSFYCNRIFEKNDVIYFLIDNQYASIFEANNPDAVEITYGEIGIVLSSDLVW